MATNPYDLDCFLAFSAEITGFTKFDLQGTGQTSLYLETVCAMVGLEMTTELLQLFTESGLQSVLDSKKLGPVARNINKLWYVATWEPFTQEWQTEHGAKVQNVDAFIVAPYAYPEGLLWKTIGVNPPAAKAPGYGTWQYAPLVS